MPSSGLRGSGRVASRPAPRRTLAVAVVAAALFLITAAVNLQQPLYPAYARALGQGSGLTSVAFAAYVAGLLPVLLLLGGLSERVGRKRAVLAGLLTAAVATAVPLLRPTLPALFIARPLQGIAVGLGLGAGTAYLTELLGGSSARAARLVATLTALGFGGGALLTSASLALHPTLVPPSYGLVLALLLLCSATLAAAAPALPASGGTLLGLPDLRPGMRRANLAIAMAWAVSGLVVALVPGQLAGHGLVAWAGPTLFVVNLSGVLAQSLARRLDAERSLRVGLRLLLAGYLLLLVGADRGGVGLVLGGAALAGAAAYGFIYLAGLAEAARLGGPERARTVSGYFLFAYLGFALPSVVVGYLGDWLGATTALALFGGALLALAAALFATGLPPSAHAPEDRGASAARGEERLADPS